MLEPLVLNLDELPGAQAALARLPQIDLQNWGPRVRLACSYGQFDSFQHDLTAAMERMATKSPRLIFAGSGDFHHVSLALLRRIAEPVNLLVIDKHPDWVGPLPIMHCGGWVLHAARGPFIHRIFHLGGRLDFDNFYRHFAPWSMLRTKKIVVFPATDQYDRGQWKSITHQALRPSPQEPFTHARLEELLAPWREELSSRPLYISLDKDVLNANEAVVNWDSGVLTLAEVCDIINFFARACDYRLAGADIVGDYSPCRVRRALRRVFHWVEHPKLSIDLARSREINSETNKVLLELFRQTLKGR